MLKGPTGCGEARLIEHMARRDGIHPYCITIDIDGQRLSGYMYGEAGFIVIDEVSEPPIKVSDIYRRLTV